MQTKSYISAAALAAALLATGVQPGLGQVLGVDLGLGDVGVEADVELGGDNLVDVDAGVDLGDSSVDAGAEIGGDSVVDVDAGADLGGDTGLDVDAGVDLGGSGSGDSLVDVDLDAGGNGTSSGAVGPNGGTLIDLDADILTDEAVLDADVDVLNGGTTDSGSGGTGLITGDVRIAALGGQDERTDSLLGLIDSPNLAGIDLDAAIDDTRVAIVAAADLFDADSLARIQAAIEAGGPGRDELMSALEASVELGNILDKENVDLGDVLAVQVAENGATEVLVLDRTVDIALLGDNGDLADIDAGDLARADIDLLSDEELAALDLDLLPEELQAAAQIRLLADNGDLADLSVADLAQIDLNLLGGSGDDTGGTGGSGGGGSDGGSGGTDDSDGGTGGSDGGTGGSDGGSGGDTGSGGGSTGGGTGGSGSDGGAGSGNDSGSDNGSGGNGSGSDGSNTGGNGGGAIGTVPNAGLPATQVGAGFGIASLGCEIGVLALAQGVDASPQAIANADSLELVHIKGCARALADTEIEAIRAAIEANPAITNVLDQVSVEVEEVVGATVQAGVLTVFVDPAVS